MALYSRLITFVRFTTNVVTALSQRCDSVVNKVISLKRITLLFPREMIGSDFLFNSIVVALFLLYVIAFFARRRFQRSIAYLFSFFEGEEESPLTLNVVLSGECICSLFVACSVKIPQLPWQTYLLDA